MGIVHGMHACHWDPVCGEEGCWGWAARMDGGILPVLWEGEELGRDGGFGRRNAMISALKCSWDRCGVSIRELGRLRSRASDTNRNGAGIRMTVCNWAMCVCA